MPPPAAPEPGPPDEVIEAAAQMLDAAPAQQQEMLEALVRAHPEREVALREMARDLAGVEQALGLGFPEGEQTIDGDIGAYRVLERLGSGAFGTVYLCQQQRPVERLVAIKVLRPDVDDHLVLERFAAERQVLAQLAHPAIAQVFDAGVLPDGRPFFVMEHIGGVPITRYCSERSLPVAACVDLLLHVCLGVAHAHHHGIVHRDLKPANVLVVDGDGGPLPKIIDFGVAKALAPAAGVARTETGRVLGTPGYMSPEQAAGHNDLVDVRADVFALGVMLYELLTGELPWSRGAGATDTDAVQPSRRLGTRSATAAASVRGDLDWITLAALQREPEQRYPSVVALIDDLQRFRRGEPVAAGPPSVARRIKRLLRRHRVASSAVLAALIVGASAAVFFWSYASTTGTALASARSEAATNLVEAELAVQKLVVLANDPRLRESPRNDALRSSLLADARAFHDRFLAAHPESAVLRQSRCKVLVQLSYLHWLLGQFEQAGVIADEATSEATALLEQAPTDVALQALLGQSKRRKACVLSRQGRNDEALPIAEAAVALLAGCHAAEALPHAGPLSSALRELATMQAHAGRPEQGLESTARSLRVLESLDGLRPETTGTMRELTVARLAFGQELLLAGRYDEARVEIDRAAATADRLPRGDAEMRGKVQSVLGHLQHAQGDQARAVVSLERAIAFGEQWRQQDPDRLLPQVELHNWFSLLAYAREMQEEFAPATLAWQQAVAIAEAMLRQFVEDRSRPYHVAAARWRQARSLWERLRQEDLAEAEASARRALEVLGAPAGAKQRELRGQLMLLLAQIVSARAGAAAADWEVVAAIVELAPAMQVEALLGLLASRLERGEVAAAQETLGRARALLARHPDLDPIVLGQLHLLAARFAGRNQDHGAAARCADAILQLEVTATERLQAGEALAIAWQCAASDAELAGGYRDRAAGLCRRVIDGLRVRATAAAALPRDALPFAQASVRLALLEMARGDAAAARALLDEGLPVLARQRTSAHADLWDGALFAAGEALAERLR